MPVRNVLSSVQQHKHSLCRRSHFYCRPVTPSPTDQKPFAVLRQSPVVPSVACHHEVCPSSSARRAANPRHKPEHYRHHSVRSETGPVALAATSPAMLCPTSLLVLVPLLVYLCAHLPSLPIPMVSAFELEHVLKAAVSSGVTVPSTSATSASTISSSGLNSSLARLLSREPRAPPPLPFQPPATLTILAILPEEHAPLITRALRDAQAKWEVSGHTSGFSQERVTSAISSKSRTDSSHLRNRIINASEIPLVVYSEPANNNTDRILSSVCEWIAVHKPVMVLSLLDRERNFYASMVAEAAGIPFVSLTQSYRNEINALGDDHQLEIDFKQATQSLFDNRPPLPAPLEESIFSEFHGPDQASQRLSLDPPIQTLADATFELLRAQYWFDAILLVDDSIVSDLFARRLSALCRNGNGNGGNGDGYAKKRQTEHDAETRRKLDNSLYGDTFAWHNFKRSSLRKSQHRADALNAADDEVQSDQAATGGAAEEMLRKRAAQNSDDFYEIRRAKEASLLDVWKNLIVVRLSRSLNQTEFYLRMAEIQTTHRRVVLVHCDWDTTQRVIETARELDLFNGDNIWILLDGLLERQQGIFESSTDPDTEDEHVDLPNGMLALRNRHRLIYDPNLLDSIVELAGKAALNSYRNQLYFGSAGRPHAATPHRSPFKLSPQSASSSTSLSSSSPTSSPSSYAPLSPSMSANSPHIAGCAVANYTDAEREHRFNILSELRNLVEPVLSRYKWNRRKPCSSLRFSAKASAARQKLNASGRSKAPAQKEFSRVFAMDRHNKRYQAEQQSADSDASAEADELETRIGASSLYRWIVPEFEILNLVPKKSDPRRSEWRTVGNITVDQSTVNTILYIGADQVPDYIVYDGRDGPYGVPPDTSKNMPDSRPLMYMTNSGKHRFRVATNIAPPFVIESTKLDNNTCLIGDFCLKVDTNVRADLVAIFTDFRSNRRLYEGTKYQVKCCAGIAIDLLNAVSRDLHFNYDLYMVADGLFGVKKNGKWDGITADLVNDLAHLSFTAFSTTSSRVSAIDFSVPFFYSGVSCLSMSSNETDVPLLAFLIPFSYELWAAIFASLFATAVAAAIYEWFSPFGLNPWGRQRTKNFSLASALWVMCSLLFSHLVAFKAPKSWPNKVLINVWGAFSVIFLATYTANIAAHFAGLFLVPEVNDFHDTSLMKQRTGTARSSASEGYLMEKYTDLWNYIQRYKVDSFDEGLEHLRAGKLDVLIGDTAILDYYRATDPGCQLRLLGDSIFDDAYAVGMQKGFPFRESISNLILKYNEYGFLDQLHRKWYGRVHCLESSSLTKPMPLTVRAEAGVFLMLAIGIGVGVVILFAEHFVFKYMLPVLRKKNKDCFWKSPNLMFFSQKLYRFINTVELVSPHHSAKEIITNLREGQIASLFQKSVKRKAKEEARRRKSKSQFFEMIQEVRKVVQRQQHERSLQEDDEEEEVADVEELDIDEEAALNTNANIRATRPSFSLAKENSLIDMDSDRMGNRISAIRFKDPEFYDDVKRKHRSGNCANKAAPPSRILVSNLKNTAADQIRKTARLTDMSSSYSNETDVPTDRSNDDAKHRREALRRSHLSSTSFSLENIFFEGLLSEGVSDPRKSESVKPRRILSFEDLPAIKKELSESSNDGNGAYDVYHGYDESSRITPPRMYANVEPMETDIGMYPSCKANGHHQQYRMPKSTTTPSSLAARADYKGSTGSAAPRSSSSANQLEALDRIGNRNLGGLSRNDILSLWRTSERELLNQLQASIDQKRALEEKVDLLQRMLKKPP